ncbi:unnamed protein product [Gadus morhua 'NCC']
MSSQQQQLVCPGVHLAYLRVSLPPRSPRQGGRQKAAMWRQPGVSGWTGSQRPAGASTNVFGIRSCSPASYGSGSATRVFLCRALSYRPQPGLEPLCTGPHTMGRVENKEHVTARKTFGAT